ncbi:MAG: hypothetical protein ACREMY_21185 [bacterium]
MYGQILVLDDQINNIEALQAAKPFWQEYLFVTDVQMALYVLYEYDINNDLDLVACNIQLRAGDAFEFIKRVKNDTHLRRLPLLCYSVTSNLGLEAVRVVAESLGADEFIASAQFDAQVLCREAQNWLPYNRGFIPPDGGAFGGMDDFIRP